jgi:predicted dehydrogenase
MSDLATIRWGITGSGWISTAFVEDLIIERPDVQAKHIIQAFGSSSHTKGHTIVQNVIPHLSPAACGIYTECHNDPNVDVISIGTLHAFYKRNCLDAIAAGKHVLCEKAFTLNTKEPKEVVAAAKEKGVFVMAAMWTRFFPLTRGLQRLLHEQKMLREIKRILQTFLWI